MYKLVIRSILLKHRIFFSLFVLLTSAVIASAANDPVAASGYAQAKGSLMRCVPHSLQESSNARRLLRRGAAC